MKSSVPGDGLLHPVVVGAIAMLLVNDHWLKAAWPGFVTGKISDVAGLVFFPLFVQAAVELALWVLGALRGPDRRVLIGAVVATGVGFALIQVWPAASDAYRWGLGLLQWPFLSVAAGGVQPVRMVHLTPDVSDLLALPALVLPLWLGWRRSR